MMPLATHDAATTIGARDSTDALEFWIAIAAGDPVWVDTDDDAMPIERWAGAMELVALAACITIFWIDSLVESPQESRVQEITPWIATAALLCLTVRPVRLVLDIRRPARLWPSFVLRVVLITTVVACAAPTTPLSGMLSMWPLAVALGVEAALCAWALGYRVEPLVWWRSFLRSGLHLGILGGVAASVLYLGLGGTVSKVLPIYLVLHIAVLGSSTVAAGIDRLRADVTARQEQAVAAAAAAEHRQSAHWLHDDVSSELKLMELQLRNGTFGAEEVAKALGDLDHQLRLRQLDELFQSGTVRLAEVLQPFVRNAQGHGVTITEVPTFDDASAMVDERLGRLVGRAVAVVSNNAIAAGATRLGFKVSSSEETIAVTVTDDAGGFDLASVPAGRGLWQLGQDLGTGNIAVAPTPSGSAVTVVLRRDGSTRPRLDGSVAS